MDSTHQAVVIDIWIHYKAMCCVKLNPIIASYICIVTAELRVILGVKMVNAPVVMVSFY